MFLHLTRITFLQVTPFSYIITDSYIVLSLCEITIHVCLLFSSFPVSSSLITLPQIYYGIMVSQTESHWEWQEVSTPFPKPSDEVLQNKALNVNCYSENMFYGLQWVVNK